MKSRLFKSGWITPTIATMLSINLALISGLTLLTLTTAGAIAAPQRWKVRFKPPNRGAPGTNGSGASRPGCPTMAKPLAVMAPISSNWGETIDAHPTFWLYQPYQGVSIQLELLDEETQTSVFSDNYTVKAGTGIVKLTVPKTAPELQVDKLYRWQISFVCNAKTQQSYNLRGAIVRRGISGSLQCQLRRAKPEDRATIFAEQGLWYNTLNEMAQLRQKQPADKAVQENWNDLLTHPEVQLDAWVNESLID